MGRIGGLLLRQRLWCFRHISLGRGRLDLLRLMAGASGRPRAGVLRLLPHPSALLRQLTLMAVLFVLSFFVPLPLPSQEPVELLELLALHPHVVVLIQPPDGLVPLPLVEALVGADVAPGTGDASGQVYGVPDAPEDLVGYA